MVDDSDQKQRAQLSLLWEVLARKDLTREKRVLFLDMRAALSKGAILSGTQEVWLRSELAKPAVDPEKSESSMRLDPVPVWNSWSWIAAVGCAALALLIMKYCLTFLIHWLGWR